MIVPRDVDPRRPAIRPCVERIEQDIDPRPVEFLNEGSGRVIDDCAALPLPNPVEHFYDDVGLAGAGSTAEQDVLRSEEHTSELQSLMRISYAVFCLKKKQHINTLTATNHK